VQTSLHQRKKTPDQVKHLLSDNTRLPA
jgi:hypothetical protein